MKKKIIVLIITTALLVLLTFLPSILPITGTAGLYFRFGIYFAIAGVAIASIIITGIRIDFDVKNWKQYLIGLGLAIVISFFAAFLPALLGHSIVGEHQDFNLTSLLISLLFFVLFVGPVEELVFRVYYQETFCGFFKKHKWIGVIIAAALFGIWHIINGSLFQVLIPSFIYLWFWFNIWLC